MWVCGCVGWRKGPGARRTRRGGEGVVYRQGTQIRALHAAAAELCWAAGAMHAQRRSAVQCMLLSFLAV